VCENGSLPRFARTSKQRSITTTTRIRFPSYQTILYYIYYAPAVVVVEDGQAGAQAVQVRVQSLGLQLQLQLQSQHCYHCYLQTAGALAVYRTAPPW
jgi:hypothetical protein